MRVAIYTRVSTEAQAREGFSLVAQLGKLRSYCSARDWEIVEEFVDDGYSGRDDSRPAYSRMMEMRDRWDTILVMRMDRIHRNSRNFMGMMEQLRTWGKEFTSMQESLDTGTAMGRFVMDIIQRIAQLESEQIAERVYMGMRQKAELGQGNLGFPAPFGYRHEGGKLVIDEVRAPIVQDAFRKHLQGVPMSWIADTHNHDGVTTNRGGKWSIWSVRYLLHNPIYAGYLAWDGVLRKGDHESLITKEDFIHVLMSFHGRARGSKEMERTERLMRSIEEL